jgi:hypothetical protein
MELIKGELSPRHKKFIKSVLKGNSYRASAKLAGYKDLDYGSRLMKDATIQNALLQRMQEAGITDTLLAKKLKDGLNAKTVPRADGGKRYDDQFVRKQFLDIIFKITGAYAPERFESVNKQITLVIDGQMLEALKDTKVLDAEELEYLEHTPLERITDGKEMDSGYAHEEGCIARTDGGQAGGEDSCGQIGGGCEEGGNAGQAGEIGPDPEGTETRREEEDREEGSIEEGIDVEGKTELG